MAIPYTVKRSKITGQAHAVFNCPGCGVQLTTPIAKAGNEDTCPDCGAIFTAPGVPERLEAEREAEERRRADAGPAEPAERDEADAVEGTKRQTSKAVAAMKWALTDKWPLTDPVEAHEQRAKAEARKRGFTRGIVIAAAWSIGVIGLFAVIVGVAVVIDEILNPPRDHYQGMAGGAFLSILIGMGMLVVAGLLRLAVFAESHLHTLAQAVKASGQRPATPNAPRSDT